MFRLGKEEGFLLQHFAGQVTYSVKGFLDKNNDTIHHDLLDLIHSSKKRVMSEMFTKYSSDSGEGDVVDPTSNRRFKSVSARFQMQLTGLMVFFNSH